MPSLRTLFPTRLWSRLGPLLRPLLGFIVAPIMPGVVIGGVLMLLGGHLNGGGGLAVKVAAHFGYPAALIGGVPLYLLLRWRGFNGWLAYLSAGALLGSLLFLKEFVLFNGASFAAALNNIIENAPLLLLAIVCSMFAAWCFWMMAQPDLAAERAENAARSASDSAPIGAAGHDLTPDQ